MFTFANSKIYSYFIGISEHNFEVLFDSTIWQRLFYYVIRLDSLFDFWFEVMFTYLALKHVFLHCKKIIIIITRVEIPSSMTGKI
jgi:hypothetical protein